MNKFSKRIIIILIYLILLLSFMGLVYYISRPEQTCFDGKKNQNEEETDCGGVCLPCKRIEAKPLQVTKTGIVPSGISGEYDLYALVINPNNVYGSGKFQYEIAVKDNSGTVLTQKKGESYILPGDKKYIIANNIKSEGNPEKIDFSVTGTDWTAFNNYYKEPELEIVNKNYDIVSSGIHYSEATGLLKNKSPFDFNSITIRIILKDSLGEVIALNSTTMGTVRSNEERGYQAFWPVRFSGDVQNMETQIEVNVFDSEAFVKRFFDNQKF